MNIIDRARELLEERRGPVLRRERAIWADTHHLYDVAGRTAQWLAGDLKSRTGYYGPCDVDEDDAPGLTDVLIRLNRSGFLTDNSQAGFDGVGYDGARWQLLASVTGYAHQPIVDVLDGLLLRTRFGLIVHDIATRRGRRGDGVAVTWRAGQACTWFGQQDDTGEIETTYDGCGPAAVADICRAKQVTVYDPEPGLNELWAVLAQVPARSRS